MKHPALVPVCCALGGFLAAWLIKPTALAPSASTDAVPKTASTRTTAAPRMDLAEMEKAQRFDPTTHTTDGTPLPPELIAARQQLAHSLDQAIATKDQGLVQRLTELLQLDPKQQQQFLLLLTSKHSTLNLFQPSADIDPQRLGEEAARAEKQFHDSLAQILTSEQISQLNQFRQQQAQNRQLAQTQKEFADVLEKIDLSPEQQSQVVQALQPLNAATEQQPDGANFFRENYDLLGYGAAGDAMSQQATANALILRHRDPTQALQELTTARKEATTRKIEALRSILSPAQLAQYAAILQARDQAYFANLAPMLNSPSSLPAED
jgi:hypothetical protein